MAPTRRRGIGGPPAWTKPRSCRKCSWSSHRARATRVMKAICRLRRSFPFSGRSALLAPCPAFDRPGRLRTGGSPHGGSDTDVALTNRAHPDRCPCRRRKGSLEFRHGPPTDNRFLKRVIDDACDRVEAPSAASAGRRGVDVRSRQLRQQQLAYVAERSPSACSSASSGAGSISSSSSSSSSGSGSGSCARSSPGSGSGPRAGRTRYDHI